MTELIQPVRGMNDILPEEAPWWDRLESAAAQIFSSYGYQRIRVPVLERTELFSRSIGEATDIVEKEMYTFEDRNGESVTLRPEGTAGVVRAGLSNGLLHNQQQKLWCRGPMFRREKPQKGRYRQFHQISVEALGFAEPEVDAEMIAMSARLWRDLGLTSVTLELNSIGTLESRAGYRQALLEYFSQNRAALDEDSVRRLDRNPLRILDSKNPDDARADRERAVARRVFGSRVARAFRARAAAAVGHRHRLQDQSAPRARPRLLHAHACSSGSPTSSARKAQCARAAATTVSSRSSAGATPRRSAGRSASSASSKCCAWTAATSRRLPRTCISSVSASRRGAAALRWPKSCATACRASRLSIGAPSAGFKAQLRRADKSGAAFAVIIGDTELAAERISVKPLREQGEQQLLTVEEFAARLPGRT